MICNSILLSFSTFGTPTVLDMHIIQRFDIGGTAALFHIISYSSFFLWKILNSRGD